MRRLPFALLLCYPALACADDAINVDIPKELYGYYRVGMVEPLETLPDYFRIHPSAKKRTEIKERVAEDPQHLFDSLLVNKTGVGVFVIGQGTHVPMDLLELTKLADDPREPPSKDDPAKTRHYHFRAKLAGGYEVAGWWLDAGDGTHPTLIVDVAKCNESARKKLPAGQKYRCITLYRIDLEKKLR